MTATNSDYWTVQLFRPLSVPFGMEGRRRTIEPGIYSMKLSMGGYRLSAGGDGFFTRTRAQIDELIVAGALTITEGDWPP